MFTSLSASKFNKISKREFADLIAFFKTIKVVRRNGIMFLSLAEEVDKKIPYTEFEQLRKELKPGTQKYKTKLGDFLVLADCRALN